MSSPHDHHESQTPVSRSRIEIRVEDDRTGMDPVTLKRAIIDHLRYTQSKSESQAHKVDWYFAISHMVRDRLVQRWIATGAAHEKAGAKAVCYLSAEFLPGRMLANNLLNVGLYDDVEKVMRDLGVELADVLEQEPDPGLGNGGLGRLAACFLDSLATLGVPAWGYGIRYEFGIFDQEIRAGRQIEHPDEWLKMGNPWEIARTEDEVVVQFGGNVTEYTDQHGRLRVRWTGGSRVVGIPYDTPVAGFGNDTVNTLRLWRARASNEFDLAVFNDGDYRKAVEEKAISESISKVLYPNDQSHEGKILRLRQQYFFVRCSIHDIVLRHLRRYGTLDDFADQVAMQLNDTHPVVGIAELMRVFLDEHGMTWDKAWDITSKVFGYTNHTLLNEALERWPTSMFEEQLPRHLAIIYEINRRFLRQVTMRWPQDDGGERIRRMSLIQEGGERAVRMAHLAVVGSHSINGVAALHTELVKKELLHDFYELWPERFNNKTNGVTPRRWLFQANPRLSAAITARIGDGWQTDFDRINNLLPFAEDAAFRKEFRAIKRHNKTLLAAWIKDHMGVDVDPDGMFDVQIKRLHEYKRQLLNCMHVVALYLRLKHNRGYLEKMVRRTVIFGGKAAPGYVMAKLHIKLINDVAEVVNHDPDVAGKLRVLFLPNYRVSLAEKIFPASDLSEQISTAGKEASGTGNMKFQMNGALTIGTLDGANVEIREEVGADNFFLFGLTAQEVSDTKRRGYRPGEYIEKSAELRAVLDLIGRGFFSPEEPELYRPIVASLTSDDPYLLCADFEAYLACQDHVAEAYRDQERWSKMAIINVAKSGKFSSDRTIGEYCREIWNVSPVPVTLTEDT